MSRAPAEAAEITVLGNAGLDLRILLPRLPRAGETLLGAEPSRACGGKGLNQAVAAARAGASVTLHAPIGGDAQGDEVLAALSGETMAVAPIRLAHPTDYSVLMVLPDGENSITGAGPCAAAVSPEVAAAIGASAGFLLVQGNLSAAATQAALRACGGVTMFNTAPIWWDPAPLLPLCRIVVANQHEAEAITGEADPSLAAARLAALGVGLVVVTLGARGCLTLEEGCEIFWPAVPVRAIDTTGCGDTFCGVLAATLHLGLAEAIGRAQRAAALTATRAGAYEALPTAAELA